MISAEIIARCSSAVGAHVKPSERSGFTTGSPLSQHKCKRDNDDRVRLAGSLLPLLVYDATGVAPAFILPLLFLFFFSFPESKPSLLYNGTVLYDRVIYVFPRMCHFGNPPFPPPPNHHLKQNKKKTCVFWFPVLAGVM